MTNSLSPQKIGLVFGVMLGGWHLLWSVLVLFGWAQPLLDWIFQIHMIRPFAVIEPFSFTMAITLIIVTSLIGYAVGYVFAMVWNRMHS